MRWNDLLLLSLQNLWRRKLRTILTIVGVTIGTCSIMIMLSIGLGANKQIMDEALQNDNLTLIRISDQTMRDPAQRNRTKVRLDDAFIKKISQLEHVVMATPVMQANTTDVNMQIRTRKYTAPAWMQAVDIEAFETLGIPFTEGGAPDPGGSLKPMQFVMGKQYKPSFQKENSSVWNDNPDIDWLNAEYTLEFSTWNSETQQQEVQKKIDMQMAGISGHISDNYYSEYDYGIFTDTDTLKRLIRENPKFFSNTTLDRYEQAYVKVDDFQNVVAVMDQVKEGNTFSVNSEMEWIDSMRRSAQSQQLMLGGIGSITMLVAAISIANTMLMSIYERTREIGVMKVLGCRLSNISLLFLGEAGFIGLFGGIVGVGLSYGMSALLNFVYSYYSFGGGGMQSYLPPWLSILALVFSIIVGIGSGLYPSQRAMRLSALAAIRNDV